MTSVRGLDALALRTTQRNTFSRKYRVDVHRRLNWSKGCEVGRAKALESLGKLIPLLKVKITSLHSICSDTDDQLFSDMGSNHKTQIGPWTSSEDVIDEPTLQECISITEFLYIEAMS